jgi:hypothetical protein
MGLKTIALTGAVLATMAAGIAAPTFAAPAFAESPTATKLIPSQQPEPPELRQLGDDLRDKSINPSNDAGDISCDGGINVLNRGFFSGENAKCVNSPITDRPSTED